MFDFLLQQRPKIIKRERSGQGTSIVNNAHVKKSLDSDEEYDDNYASLSWRDELNVG